MFGDINHVKGFHAEIVQSRLAWAASCAADPIRAEYPHSRELHLQSIDQIRHLHRFLGSTVQPLGGSMDCIIVNLVPVPMSMRMVNFIIFVLLFFITAQPDTVAGQ